MLALHVFRTEEVIEEAEEIAPQLLKAESVEHYKTDPEALLELHEICMGTNLPGKLVVTVLGGSTLEGQLPVLAEYSIQLEVCTVTYSHTWGGFGGVARSESAPVGSLTSSWSLEGPNPHRYRDISFPTTLPSHLEQQTTLDDERRALNDWMSSVERLVELQIIKAPNDDVVGGYAELLAARWIGGARPEGPDTGADLIVGDERVQVKGRRDPATRQATHWDIRQLDVEGRFDSFVGVVFEHDFGVRGAWKLPWHVVRDLANPPNSRGIRRLPIGKVEAEAARGNDMIEDLLEGAAGHQR